ncbi:MAG TPA: hypothetical protein VI039_13575 [Solirubrobacterales bacterium]
MLVYFNGKTWTRREVLIWLSVLIAMVVFGVLSVTDVLGPWAALVASVFVLGVGLMRYRAEVKLNAPRVEHGADRPGSAGR